MRKQNSKTFSITIDNKLKFVEHLSNVCLKANRKVFALTIIRKYLDIKKKMPFFKQCRFLTQPKFCSTFL